jgi:hypothetical protein
MNNISFKDYYSTQLDTSLWTWIFRGFLGEWESHISQSHLRAEPRPTLLCWYICGTYEDTRCCKATFEEDSSWQSCGHRISSSMKIERESKISVGRSRWKERCMCLCVCYYSTGKLFLRQSTSTIRCERKSQCADIEN